MGAIRPWTTMRLLGAMLVFMLSNAPLAQPVAAQDAPVKLALIIANSGYESGDWPNLKNPVSDARLLRTSLEDAGFRVARPAVNLRRPQLIQRIEEFRSEVATLPENSIALIYFSGHGIQVDGQNYLVPVGAGSFAAVEAVQGAARERVLSEQFVSLNTLLDVFGRLRRELPEMANVLILDACRVNPLDGKTRGAGRSKGLADVSPVSNSLIAFAAEPGKVAYDGDGENSPFAVSLSEQFKQKTLPLNLLFSQARVRTMALTGNEQRPIYQDALSGTVCLERCDLGRVVAARRPPLAGTAGSETRGGVPAFAQAAEAGCEFCPKLVAVTAGASKLEFGLLPVSLKEWQACVEESSCRALPDADPKDDLPATGVTWEAARDYAAWLSDRTGERWRLPSAEEWRSAFAAQKTAPRRVRRSLAPLRSAGAAAGDSPGYAGQILEWTGSCPDGAARCTDRLALGAAYDDDYSDLLASQAFPAANSGKSLGFRVVREFTSRETGK